MILSLIILILSFGNASIKEIAIAGIKLNFAENILFVYKIIWMIWGYFLYRYFIYFMDEGRPQLSSHWDREFEGELGDYIRSKVYEKYKKPNEGCGYSYYHTKRNNMIYQGEIYVEKFDESTQKKEEKIEHISMPIDSSIVYYYQFKAFLKFSLLRPVVTDYVFVFIFSAAVVVVSEISNWDGSLFNVFA